ncbi:MAG: MucBP domain-containing protein [Clostridiaceae bacterium]|nr:MucBP domain-containing protein [Clostridiaceae bacterium]
MKKNNFVMAILLAIVMIFTVTAPAGAISGAPPEFPMQIDTITQVYDKGNGEFRLILQTDTAKDKGKLDTQGTVKLGPLVEFVDVTAGHSTDSANVSASYDEDEHKVVWHMYLGGGKPVGPFGSFWPINSLVIDFRVADGAYGDILVFEKASYTTTNVGSDSSYESEFLFWQNAVRVSPPLGATVETKLYSDSGFSNEISTVNDKDGDVYAKFIVTNPNDFDLEAVQFSSDFDLKSLGGTPDTGSPISQDLVADNTISFELKGKEVLELTAKIEGNSDNFTADEMTLEATVITTYDLYSTSLTSEDVLGNSNYRVLLTEDQMEVFSLKTPFVKPMSETEFEESAYSESFDDYGDYVESLWDSYGPYQEGDPYKTNFQYNANQYNPEERLITEQSFASVVYEKPVVVPDPVYSEDVTVKYVDKDGKNIVDPVILSGGLGASWKAEEKSIDGWTIAERPSVVSGVFTTYAQEVIFVYERASVGTGDVTVKYVDEDGNDIVDPVILTGKIGESWEAEEKDIIGWVLSVIPDNVSGKFTSESQIVIFVYLEEVVKGDEDDVGETPDDLNPPVTGEPALYMLLAILMVLGGTLLMVPSLKRAWAKNKKED